MSDHINNEKMAHAEKRKKHIDQIKKSPVREERGNSNRERSLPSSSQIIFSDKEWYKKMAMFSLFNACLLGVCAAAVSFALAYALNQPTESLSFTTDQDGRVVELKPISVPTLTETQVLNFASEKILNIHKLTFMDYVDHIQSQRDDFTSQAFIEYQKALLASKSLEKVKSQQLAMWAKPIEAPKIVSSKVVGGKYTWVVEMKIVQYLAGGEFTATGTEMLSHIVIERTSRSKNLTGVIISKYLAKEIMPAEGV